MALLAACGLVGAVAPPGLASTGRPSPIEYACPAGTVPPSSFGAVAGNPHQHAIACMAWYAITQGATPDSYAPEALVRRDQMATFLTRALDALRIPLPGPGDRFDDVSPVHADSVERLTAAGVIAGTGPRTYAPDLPISRAQMATLLRRTYDDANTALPADRDVQDYFSDDAASPHRGEIDLGFRNGFLSGVQGPVLREHGTVATPGRSAPAAPVRRDQMASFLGRLLGRAVLSVPGSTNDPYLRGTRVPLVDGFALTVVGSAQDATQEVLAFDRSNPPPRDGHRYSLFRVRVVNAGSRSASFDTDARLVARNVGVTPGGPVFSAADEPCGRIPDPLGEPVLQPGGAAEGNVCFEVRAFSFASTTWSTPRSACPPTRT